jgi:octaprenyl-diphosphate synthase
MSTVRQPPADLQQALAALYQSVGSELRRVDARLADELRSDHAQANEVIRHGIRLSGKRLRPALLLLAGQAVGPLRDEHITLAAVVEMIHTATLVHDDVLDEAAIRRHEDTVNARWNNETSVLLGDFLFTHAFYLASTLESTYACRTIGRATNIVCDGELRQTISSGDVNLSEDDYLTIVEAKTAELCACCCELGAYYAGGDEEMVARLAAFGRNLGIAFQIADDLLDLEGNELATGKSLGTDLAKRKMTLPLIHARESLEPSERKKFLTALASLPLSSGEGRGEGGLNNGTREILLNYIARHDSFNYAREQAQLYADRAQQQLSLLADSPAKDALAALTDFAIARRG